MAYASHVWHAISYCEIDYNIGVGGDGTFSENSNNKKFNVVGANPAENVLFQL